MRAVITKTLLRPTRFGRTITKEIIKANKQDIEDKVNEYIYWRTNAHNYIPVTSFQVEIKDYKNRTKKQWTYKPTYS